MTSPDLGSRSDRLRVLFVHPSDRVVRGLAEFRPVLPTELPLAEFYGELVKTRSVLARKHLGAAAVAQTMGLADHQRPVAYDLPVPEQHSVLPKERRALYIHNRVVSR